MSYLIVALSIALAWPSVALAQGNAPGRDVRVINTPSEAVPIKSPARIPWQAGLNLDLNNGETSRLVALPAPAPGKRIVIESGSAQLLVLRTQVPYIQLFLSMTGNDPAVVHTFALTNVGAYTEGQYVWQSTHSLRLTSAQGTVRVLRAGGDNGPFFASLSLSGFEEDNQ